MGQTNVERLVRTHNNLLEASLDEWHATVLPWGLEMVIEEPEPESD